MIKIQIVSAKNSAWYPFCYKKGYKNENMIQNNKILFENAVFTLLYQKLLATIIYINKALLKCNQDCKGKLKQSRIRRWVG